MDTTRGIAATRRWTMGMVTLIFALVVSVPVLGQPASQTKPKLYTFPFVKGEGVSQVVFNKEQQYFMTLFKMSTKFELLTDEEIKLQEATKQKAEKRKTTKVSAPWLEKADNLLWKGKDLIVKKSYNKAITSLNKAKELYEKHYLELRDYDKLVDANLQLSIAFFLAGYKDNGEELLKDVLVWRPTLVVDRKKYPKPLVESLESLRELLEGRKGGVVRVESTPADGAKVYVDGLLKGTLGQGQSGIDIKGLYRGKHYVQVIKDGYSIWAKKVGVPAAGRTAKVAARLTEAVQEQSGASGEWEALAYKTYDYAASGAFGMKFSKQAKAFADHIQVPYLLFGFVSQEPRGTKLTLFLFKAEWSGLAEVEPVGFDENLTNLQVNLLFLEANLASALAKFPKDRVVRGTPEVYLRSQELAAKKAEPPPVVVKKEEAKVEPPPVVVKVEPPPVVVKKEEKVEPVRVTPTVVEKDPVLTSRTEPEKKPDEDLGDLSSIFSDSGDTDNGPLVTSGITDPGKTTWDDNNKGKDDSIVKKWWFWTGVVAGAGLLGGGGYMLYDGLSGSSAPSGYSAQLAWPTR